MNLDEIVCGCRDITRGEVVEAVKGGAKTLEALEAMDICPNGCCEITMEEIIEQNS
ncbi:MAG: (2Fe-2S)-binding protein [Defluviitaleaceae bacterium]|nr:(2Fe-2S)-binding protein [Defluviitaleaceae bacterium]